MARHRQQRLLVFANATRRLRCTARHCGWGGLIGSGESPPGGVGRGAFRIKLALSLLLGLGVLAAAVLWLAASGGTLADRGAHPGGVHQLAPGEHSEGVAIKVGLATPAPSRAAAGGSAAAAFSPVAGTSAADSAQDLTLRQGCIWGKPGSNPYRGTIEQALRAGRLPPELIAPLAQRIRDRQPSDRVAIRTGAIRSERGGREFSSRDLALSFGQSMCLNSRVNFKPGHVEPGDLYEVTDAAGRQRAVIVPDVCGNVSVLSGYGERNRLQQALAGPLDWLASTLGSGAESELDEMRVRAAVAGGESGFVVPEPGSLALVLSALVALLWLGRRR